MIYSKKRRRSVFLLSALLLSACGGNNVQQEEFKIRDAYRKDSAYMDQLEDLKKTDFTAKWIFDKTNSSNAWVAFRKSFSLTSIPQEAITYLSADSKYYLWVNGTLAVFDGSLKRGITSYDSYYDTIDIASYLQTGENLIAVLVSVNGRTGYSSVDSGAGGLFLEAHIDDQIIESDSSFKVKKLEAYKTLRNEGMVTGALAERPINYDANLNIGEWYNNDYDDSNWDNAREIASVGEEPFGDMYNRLTPMTVFSTEYTDFENSESYLGKTFTEDTEIELTLPQNSHVSLYFELTSQKEDLTLTYYGKWADETLAQLEYYTTCQGEQSFESLPWRSGESMIIEVPAGITFQRLAYRESHYDTQYSEFTSDNEDLNNLWSRASNTLRVCMRDTFMDCPDRERGSYTGDSVNQMLISFNVASPTASLLMKKLYLTELGWTGEDHILETVAPGEYADGEIVCQNLALVASTYDYLLYTGDEDTLKRFYQAALNYLALFDMDSNGLISYRLASFDWTDWGEEPMDNKPLQVAWYYYALTSLEKVAQKLNLDFDSSFTQRKESIKNAYDKIYWKEEGYASEEGTYDERVQAMAVIAGLAGEDKYPTLMKRLSDENSFACSPYMELYCEKALCIMEAYDNAKDRILSRYSSMLASQDTTTLWEGWEVEPLGTRNHGWSGGLAVAIGSYFAGIEPTDTGFKEYRIAPQETLGSFSIEKQTVKGDISLSVEESNGERDIQIETIQDAIGTLIIPSSFGSNIEISGDDFEDLGTVDGSRQFKLYGGNYSLHIQKA